MKEVYIAGSYKNCLNTTAQNKSCVKYFKIFEFEFKIYKFIFWVINNSNYKLLVLNINLLYLFYAKIMHQTSFFVLFSNFFVIKNYNVYLLNKFVANIVFKGFNIFL